MIQSSFVENRSVQFRVLSEDQIWEIKQAALDVLEGTGCQVQHPGAVDLLRKAGAVVKGSLDPGAVYGGVPCKKIQDGWHS